MVTSDITKPLYPWLKPVWRRLSQLFVTQKVPHALLLTGAKGIGKANLAQAFAKLLLCQSAQEEGACGKCRACYLFEQRSHPDVRYLGEEEGIGIDDVREMMQFLDQTSHQQGVKVVMLFQCDKLQSAPANALLKTLEEPLGKTVLILIAEQPKNLFSTLKSRCTHIHISTPQQEALSWLQQYYPDHTLEVLQQYLALGAGSPLVAQELLSATPEVNKWRHAFNQAMLKPWNNPLDSEDVQQFIATQPKEALYLLYYWLTELVRSGLQSPTGNLYTQEEAKQIQQLLQKISLKKIFIFFESVMESIQTLSLPGTNKQLLFENLFYQWQSLYGGGERR